MDDFTAEYLAHGHSDDSSSAPPSPERTRDPDPSHKQPSSLRSGFGFGGLGKSAGIQDRLVEKLLSQVIPDDADNAGSDAPILPGDRASAFAQRPNFNIATMSNNFRRFNARIGVVFKFQAKVLRILAWRKSSETLSLLAVYTFVCLDPYLLCVLPIAGLVLGVLIPAFLARHPAPPKGTLSSDQNVGYSPVGPPLAPAATVRPVKELSKDFFRNMRDLQNVMDDFSVVHDKVVALLVPLTNFSNEALSSTVFLFLVFGGIFTTITAQLLPWRVLFLLGGWAMIISGHPTVARLLADARQAHQPQEHQAKSWLDHWIATDVILDSAPEAREVEIFELQKMSSAGEWEAWLFSPPPYDPLSHARLAGERARGTRFFEDVKPPEGWEWSEKKWALDLWSREWVEERIITGVEVETEGERWVYDIYRADEHKTGVIDADEPRPPTSTPQPSWEEGEDGSGLRGDWRRRRWVRLVKRKVASAPPQ